MEAGHGYGTDILMQEMGGMNESMAGSQIECHSRQCLVILQLLGCGWDWMLTPSPLHRNNSSNSNNNIEGTVQQHTIHINFSFINNSKRIEIIKISIFTLNLNSTRIIISCATRVFLIYYGWGIPIRIGIESWTR